MNVENLEGHISNFEEVLNQASLTFGVAVTGIRWAVQTLGTAPRYPQNPDPYVYTGVGDPNLPGSVQFASMKLSELKTMFAENGPATRLLGQQWAVLIDTQWEEHFRGRIAEALGCEKNDLKIPVFGDLRKIRNDIVHHRGIATRQNAGRCEILSHWCQPGQPIEIEGTRIAEFRSRIPWDELRSRPHA